MTLCFSKSKGRRPSRDIQENSQTFRGPKRNPVTREESSNKLNKFKEAYHIHELTTLRFSQTD